MVRGGKPGSIDGLKSSRILSKSRHMDKALADCDHFPDDPQCTSLAPGRCEMGSDKFRYEKLSHLRTFRNVFECVNNFFEDF